MKIFTLELVLIKVNPVKPNDHQENHTNLTEKIISLKYNLKFERVMFFFGGGLYYW